MLERMPQMTESKAWHQGKELSNKVFVDLDEAVKEGKSVYDAYS